MAQAKYTKDLTELLLKCIGESDPMLSMLERLNKEIRRRTNVIGIFPNENSYIRLVTSYLIEYSEDWSTGRSYINKSSLSDLLPQAA